jgi:hypothetical protein
MPRAVFLETHKWSDELLGWEPVIGGSGRRSIVVMSLLASMAFVACADDGDDDTADRAGDSPVPAGPEAPADVDDGGDGGGNVSPPTAGGGHAGEYTGPGYVNEPPIGCEPVDIDGLIEAGEYEQLLSELDCILDSDEASPEALEAARAAVAYVGEIEGGGETTEPTTTLPPIAGEPDDDVSIDGSATEPLG